MGIWKSLKENNEPISATTAILGLIVATLGFSITIYQLSETSKALKATNTYNIQKDSRSIIEEVQARKNVEMFIKGTSSEAQSEKALDDLWKMFNFYLSVFRQDSARGISSEFAKSFQNDFCDFTSISQVADAWDEMAKDKKIGASHFEMKRDWCE